MLSAYENHLKNFWDLNNCLDTAERKGREEGREEGFAEGLEKGEAIGLEKGEAIGLEKGIYKEKTENARKLKELGVSPDLISKATGLSIEEIEKL